MMRRPSTSASRHEPVAVFGRVWGAVKDCALGRQPRLAALALMVALAANLTGCVSKAAAERKAHQAFVAGQQQAMMQLQQSRGPSVTVLGQVHNQSVPWTEDLTLAKAVVAAEYYGPGAPRAIYLVRQGRAISIDPKALLGGQDVPLQAGDIVDLRN
jgi:hypothetical protein